MMTQCVFFVRSWIDPVQDVDRPIEMAEIVHPTLGGGILLLDKDSGDFLGQKSCPPGVMGCWVSFGMACFGMLKGRSLFLSFPGRNFEDYNPKKRIISFRSISNVISPLRTLNKWNRFFSQLDEIRVWNYTYMYIYIYYIGDQGFASLR